MRTHLLSVLETNHFISFFWNHLYFSEAHPCTLLANQQVGVEVSVLANHVVDHVIVGIFVSSI